jgi:Ca-activated chloride channel family protein
MAIALDTSGSMLGEKLVRSKKACDAVVSLLRGQDRLWLAGFATSLTQVADGVPGGSDEAKSVLAKIEGLAAHGVTRTDIALQWIEACLRDTPGTTRVGILVTDGKPTDPKGKQEIDTTPLLQMADRMGHAGMTICAVGLGNANSYNSALLTQISDRGRGAFLYADSPDALEELLSNRLNASQTVAAADCSLEIERMMAGATIISACRFRPEYLPLEPLETDTGSHVEIGSLRADVDTDILLDVEVPAPRDDTWQGFEDIFEVKVFGGDAISCAASARAGLTNTASYTEAQRRNSEVDKDRLNWDVNKYSDALIKVQEQDKSDAASMRKTGQLLSGMEQRARRAGNEPLAANIAAQITDLRKTGRLDAHRATGLLTASRSLGMGDAAQTTSTVRSNRATGVLAETPPMKEKQ